MSIEVPFSRDLSHDLLKIFGDNYNNCNRIQLSRLIRIKTTFNVLTFTFPTHTFSTYNLPLLVISIFLLLVQKLVICIEIKREYHTKLFVNQRINFRYIQ